MKYFLGLLLFLAPFVQSIEAKFDVAKIFSSHMVLQRDVRVPVWGSASRDEKITVGFGGRTYKARIDNDGRWVAYLPPMKAGGPYEMRIRGNGNEIVFEDILIGDVWLCSGQSNMEWTVAQSMNAKKEIASASDRRIRHFKIPKSHSYRLERDLVGGEWQDTSPKTVGDFTAVGYYFARSLRKHQQVPIGLLNSSWGGSRIEAWMTARSLDYRDQKTAVEEIMQIQRDRVSRLKASLSQQMKVIPEKDLGLVDGVAVWSKSAYDDSDWKTMTLPGQWEKKGYPGLDGIVWFRKTITLTARQAKRGITLNLGKIDDSDITWINGKKVAETIQKWNQPRKYDVSPGLLRAGSNTITVRVDDTGGGGGFHGDPSLMFFTSGSDRSSLSGLWKYKVGEARIPEVFAPNQVPTILYNRMIHPIINFPIKGVLWYQGESNAGGDDAYKYRRLFATMVTDWRNKWGVGEFPFLWVQLANFMAADDRPSESSWAVLRESQSSTLSLANTGQAVTIDIGEADDIHPGNKQDVGFRLSLAARKLAYGENVVHSGPVYESMSIDRNRVRLKFELFGSELWAKGPNDNLKGFAIAGEDKNFVWADARIDGNEVVVWSERIAKPVAVRYAWGNNPEGANLYNKEGLPASPFRTDGKQ